MKAYRIWSLKPYRCFWVADIPHPKGTKPAIKYGVDWGYTTDFDKAIKLTPYWQRRFAAHCHRMGANPGFATEYQLRNLRLMASGAKKGKDNGLFMYRKGEFS